MSGKSDVNLFASLPFDTMGLSGVFNYVLFDNPLSQGVKSVTKTVLSPVFKQGASQLSTPTVIVEHTPLYKLAAEHGPFVRIAGLFGASAMGFAAYGAHGPFPKGHEDELKPIYETANRLHFFNSLALLGVPLCRRPQISGSLLILGTILFCTPCYYHALTGENKFGKVAPIGGTILICSWLAMVL